MTSACLEDLGLDLHGPAGNTVGQIDPSGFFIPVQLSLP